MKTMLVSLLLLLTAASAYAQTQGGMCAANCPMRGMGGGAMMGMMFLGALTLLVALIAVAVYLFRRSRPTTTP